MKKIFAIAVTGLFCISAMAQNIVPLGMIDGKPSLPLTTIFIDITVEQQDIVAGPYARYAQKYLGITVAMSDKVLNEITNAKIGLVSNLTIAKKAKSITPLSHMQTQKGFPKLLIDRMSNAQLSLEENARLAAEQIFKIRKSRYELITGEAGENVFGAGLGYALKELNRLEEEYLSLFLGKQVNTITTRQYKVTPTEGKHAYVVCRFSNVDGLLPQENLSGQPILLEIGALNTLSTDGLSIVTKPIKTDSAFRIADDTSCRIVFDNVEIASEIIPVFQFGRTVYIR